MNKASADVIIFGGGIAGLWLLNLLRKKGYSALLFESGTLGGGQTNKSQGIIHGGMKYALQGLMTSDAKAMLSAPDTWRQCLTGKDDMINLSAVPILSSCQYLWSPSRFTSKITGFLASTALSSKVNGLDKANYPAIFQHPKFKGEVFSLDEMVLDVPILVRELVKDNQDAIYKIEPLNDEELKFDDAGNLISATVYLSGKSVEISAQQFVFTAGAGNEIIIKKLHTDEVAMQRRPLHMVMVKMPVHFALYAHCLGVSARPRVTITTHYTNDGSTIWYIGGQLAEDGVTRDRDAQIQAAKEELRQLFPWINFNNAEFATLLVDRAEPYQKNGLKPESYYFKAIANMVIAWPTKLALAPKLAENIVAHFQAQALTPQLLDLRELRIWLIPPIASPIWEEAFCKHVA